MRRLISISDSGRRDCDIPCMLIQHLSDRYSTFKLKSCKEKGVSCSIRHGGTVKDSFLFDIEKYRKNVLNSPTGVKVVDCVFFVNSSNHHVVLVELKSGRVNIKEIQSKFTDSFSILNNLGLTYNLLFKFVLVRGKASGAVLKGMIRNQQTVVVSGKTYRIIIGRPPFQLNAIVP